MFRTQSRTGQLSQKGRPPVENALEGSIAIRCRVPPPVQQDTVNSSKDEKRWTVPQYPIHFPLFGNPLFLFRRGGLRGFKTNGFFCRDDGPPLAAGPNLCELSSHQ